MLFGIKRMIKTKKKFLLKKSQLNAKFRVENNNLDLSSILLNNNFQIVKLRDIASYHRENRNTSKSKDVFFKYVQISDININLGIIKSCTIYKGNQAPNNARRIMHKDDILVSTRRPTRGAIVTVPDTFDGEICTVFFTTLQVLDTSAINPHFLSLFLRTSFCRYQFESMITETAYPVITDDDVLDMIILVPSLDKQNKIVADYHEAIKKFKDHLNSAYDQLIKSKQRIENLVLGNESERLVIPTFNLQIFNKDGEEISLSDSNLKDKLNHFKPNKKKHPRLDDFL